MKWKLIKYTGFPKIRKIAILRGPKLSRCSIFLKSVFTIWKISPHIFICQNFISIRSTTAELWASQNRDFSDFRKTRVFYQLPKIWRKWPFHKGKSLISAIISKNRSSSLKNAPNSILIEDSWFSPSQRGFSTKRWKKIFWNFFDLFNRNFFCNF